MPRELLVKKIEASMVEVVNSVVRVVNVKHNIFTNWDNKMTKTFKGLTVPKLVGVKTSAQ